MMVEQILEKIRAGKESEEDLAQIKDAFSKAKWPELDRILEADWQKAGEGAVDPETSRLIWNQLSVTNPFQRYKWWLALPAGIILILAVRFLAASGNMITSNFVEQINDTNELMTIQLEEGSTVILNKGSSLRYPEPFRKDCRDVWLNGEAYFQVSKQPDRSFRVITEQLETSGPGTEFNIRAYAEDNHATISLFAGKVAITPKQRIESQPGRWLLEPGDQMRYQKVNQTPIVFRFDSTLTLAWRENRIAFDETPMASAFLQLENHFGTKIEFDPEKIIDCFARGNFTEEATLEYVLRKILPYRKLKFKVGNDAVQITGKGCRSTDR